MSGRQKPKQQGPRPKQVPYADRPTARRPTNPHVMRAIVIVAAVIVVVAIVYAAANGVLFRTNVK